MDRLLATLASVLPSGEPPEWIKLVPIGTIPTVDGRGPYKVPDQAAAQAIVSVSMANNRPLPIDYDHAIDLAAPKGGPAPAAGWIEELQARADGIWARVKWTERASASIRSLEYRYISPTFFHDAAGQVKQILRAALTNNPNFQQLPALAGAFQEHHEMKELLEKLVQLFGLPANADQTMVLAAAEQMIGERATTAASVKGVAAVMGLPETATLAEIKNAIVARNAALAKSVGLPETASTADIDKALATAAATAAAAGNGAAQVAQLNQTIASLNARINELESAQQKEKATAAVDQAIKDGKLQPSLRDWGLALAQSDMKAFEDYVAKVTPVLKPGADNLGGTPPAGAEGLDANELAVCSALGINPEDFKKTKAQEAR